MMGKTTGHECFDDCVGNTVVTAAVVEGQKTSKLKIALKLNCKFDSMTLALFSPNENLVTHTHTLHTMNKSNKMSLVASVFEHI